ncbi:hypothetical protein GCM10011491_34960 [Brucella endophytica]|uniref:Uncharacterized protein n=1 Tax=Brucella endophytica TaxID=1963359 RepID=A0A916SLX2_9HYPH|nr:hypothetical protein GCM10011491_34960 [Brucella endophytica]
MIIMAMGAPPCNELDEHVYAVTLAEKDISLKLYFIFVPVLGELEGRRAPTAINRYLDMVLSIISV